MAKTKRITPNQILGEIGETAVKGRFLSMGFQFDGRSRLEAGIDGVVEVMLEGQPMARMAERKVQAGNPIPLPLEKGLERGKGRPGTFFLHMKHAVTTTAAHAGQRLPATGATGEIDAENIHVLPERIHDR